MRGICAYGLLTELAARRDSLYRSHQKSVIGIFTGFPLVLRACIAPHSTVPCYAFALERAQALHHWKVFRGFDRRSACPVPKICNMPGQMSIYVMLQTLWFALLRNLFFFFLNYVEGDSIVESTHGPSYLHCFRCR